MESTSLHNVLILTKEEKTFLQLLRLTAVTSCLHLCYSVETLFVTSAMLILGLDVSVATAVWCIAAIIGLILTPIFGSFSDTCRSRMGRRRPFITFFSLSIVFGLMLLAYAPNIQFAMAGDHKHYKNLTNSRGNVTQKSHQSDNTISIVLTAIGITITDVAADLCHAPTRAYIFETVPASQHDKALQIIIVTGGLAGLTGSLLGGSKIGKTYFGELLGGQTKTIMLFTALMLLICLVINVTTFKEIPLPKLQKIRQEHRYFIHRNPDYGSIDDDRRDLLESCDSFENSWSNSWTDSNECDEDTEKYPKFTDYLWSVIYMPSILRKLCFTNMLSWVSIISVTVFYPDFVGSEVFGGDPTAALGTTSRSLYDDGLRWSSYGVGVYFVTSIIFSTVSGRIIDKFGCKSLYVGSHLLNSVGSLIIAIVAEKFSTVILLTTTGIVYSVTFTIPYKLIKDYHRFQIPEFENRGLGVDLQVVTSMIFIGQLASSAGLGSVIKAVDSSSVIMYSSAISSFLTALAASQVSYVDRIT